MKKTILCCLLVFCISKAESRPYESMLESTLMQLVSFHIGSNRNLQTPHSKTSLILGASIGWNYYFIWRGGPPSNIFGLRLKYLYTSDRLQTQSIGGVFYWHIPTFDEDWFALALTLGGGTLFNTKDEFQSIGKYAEVGFALWKTLPINVDILYRINIYIPSAMRDYPIGHFTHNLSFVFTFF